MGGETVVPVDQSFGGLLELGCRKLEGGTITQEHIQNTLFLKTYLLFPFISSIKCLKCSLLFSNQDLLVRI